MKKSYCLLLVLLFCCTGSIEAKKLFIRIFDQQGHKIAKGHFTATTDTSLILQGNKTQLEILLRDIGTIKTRRTFSHHIAAGAIIGGLSGAFLGLVSGQANEEAYGFVGYESDPGNDAITGTLSGIAVGGAVGLIIAATQKRKTLVINGDANTWQQHRKILDNMLSNR